MYTVYIYIYVCVYVEGSSEKEEIEFLYTGWFSASLTPLNLGEIYFSSSWYFEF